MSNSCNEWLPVPLRLAIGGWLMYHGLPKLFFSEGHANITHLLAEMNVPFPEVMAWYAGVAEFFGGFLLLVGFLVRLVSALNILNISATVLNALVRGYRYGWENSFPKPLSELPPYECSPYICQPLPGFEYSSLYIAGLLVLLLAGAGVLSIDRLFSPGDRQSLSAKVRQILWE